MFKFKLAFLSLISAIALATSVYSADATFQASITIYQPVVISNATPLSFPDTESAQTIQTVTVTPSEGASFTIAGEKNYNNIKYI